MFAKKISISAWILLVVFLAACSSPAQAPSGPSPETVVSDFYDWYLGDPAAGPKDALESPALSPDLVERIQESRKNESMENLVNFVCAQDFPESMDVQEAKVNGNDAVVSVKSSFGSNISVSLKVVDGAWKITDVSCSR